MRIISLDTVANTFTYKKELASLYESVTYKDPYLTLRHRGYFLNRYVGDFDTYEGGNQTKS